MKALLLVRHAKSSWTSAADSDLDRPLNERGKNDAPKMARRLEKKNINIDTIVTSPAKRAKKTACIFLEEFGLKKKQLREEAELYEASTQNFLNVIKQLDDDDDVVAMFSHNPGLTDFVNTLTEETKVDNMPTCSVFAVKADINSWQEFEDAKKELWFFDFPKNGKD